MSIKLIKLLCLNIILIFAHQNSFAIDVKYKNATALNKAIHVFNDNEIIIAGQNGKLMKSKDAGNKWEWIENNIRTNYQSICFNHSGYGVINTKSELLISNDKGDSWQFICKSADSIAFAFIDDNSKFVFYPNGNKFCRYSIENKSIDTLFTLDDVISSFQISDSVTYLSTKKFFYKFTDNKLNFRTELKDLHGKKRFPLIKSLCVDSNYVMLVGAYLDSNNYSNAGMLLYSYNEGIDFEKKDYNLFYLDKILFYKNQFLAKQEDGVAFYFDKNFNIVKSDTAFTKNFVRFSIFFPTLTGLYLCNNKVYFTGHHNSWGFFTDSIPFVSNYVRLVGLVSGPYISNYFRDNNNHYFFGSHLLIYKSDNECIYWKNIFPIDTAKTFDSSLARTKINAYHKFKTAFRNQTGIRFVGEDANRRPWDFQYVFSNNSFEKINKLKFNEISDSYDKQYFCASWDSLYQDKNQKYFRLNYLFYSNDFGDNWKSIKLVDSNFFSYLKGFSSLFPLRIIQMKNNPKKFLVIYKVYMNEKDTVNNPEKNYNASLFLELNTDNEELKFIKLLYHKLYSPSWLYNNNKFYEVHTYPDTINTTVNFYNENLEYINSRKFSPRMTFHFEDDKRWIGVFYNDSICISNDAGNTWRGFKVNESYNYHYYLAGGTGQIFKIQDNKYLLLGEGRLIVIEVDFGPNDLAENPDKKHEDMFYPNPAVNTIITNKNGTIRIYGINGMLIKTLENCLSNAPISISDLENGIYILNIESDGKNYYNKLIIQR